WRRRRGKGRSSRARPGAPSNSIPFGCAPASSSAVHRLSCRPGLSVKTQAPGVEASWFGGRLDAHGRDDVGADSVVVPRHERVAKAVNVSRQRLTRPSTGEVARTLWDGQGPCGEHVVRAGAEPSLPLTPS